MSRMMTLATAIVALLTVLLFDLIRKDLAQARHDEIQAASIPSAVAFTGLDLDGRQFVLSSGPESSLVGLFMLRGASLPQEVAAWNALKEALAPSAVQLIGTCEDAPCVTRLQRDGIKPGFVVLSATTFSHSRLLLRLNERGKWLLCDRAGVPKALFDAPTGPGAVAALAQQVRDAAKGIPNAQALR